MDPTKVTKDHLTLHRRAHELAKPLKTTDTLENLSEILVFSLAHERYAIETQYIKEVFTLSEFTPLPGTPSFLLGLVNLRRKIITVIDLRILFHLATDATANRKLVLLGNSEKEFAIVTDSIQGIQRIPLGTIDAPPPTLSGLRDGFLSGVTADHIAILDGGRLLTSRELVVEETVEATT